MNDQRPTTKTEDRGLKIEDGEPSSFYAPSPVVVGPSCVTCSDEALPATVLRVDQETGMALVTIDDTTIEVDITLVDTVAPDDLVLVHGGVAIAKL